MPKVKLEIFVVVQDMEKVMSKGLKPGGRRQQLFVLPVEEVTRVRTGEKGKEAILVPKNKKEKIRREK